MAPRYSFDRRATTVLRRRATWPRTSTTATWARIMIFASPRSSDDVDGRLGISGIVGHASGRGGRDEQQYRVSGRCRRRGSLRPVVRARAAGRGKYDFHYLPAARRVVHSGRVRGKRSSRSAVSPSELQYGCLVSSVHAVPEIGFVQITLATVPLIIAGARVSRLRNGTSHGPFGTGSRPACRRALRRQHGRAGARACGGRSTEWSVGGGGSVTS